MHISEEDFRNAIRPRIETLSEEVRNEINPFYTDTHEEAEEALNRFQETSNFSELFEKMVYLEFMNKGYDEIAAEITIMKYALKGYEEVFSTYNLSDVTKEKLTLVRDDLLRKYELYKTRLQ